MWKGEYHLRIEGPSLIKNCVEGCVKSINSAGDLVTDIAVQNVSKAPNLLEVKIKVGDHETIGIYPDDHDEPDGTLIAVDKSGLIEIGITGMSISEMLGLAVDEKVTIKW